MEFRQINDFIALIEEGTVMRAAHRMNIVQPALSMQIARLEEQVGQRLFDRTRPTCRRAHGRDVRGRCSGI